MLSGKVLLAQVNIGQTFDPTNARPATFGEFVNVIVKNAFVIAGVLTFVLLVLGGLGFIMGAGSGDTKKMEKSKQTITGALIGLLLIIGSIWIIQLIESLTGIKLLNPTIR